MSANDTAPSLRAGRQARIVRGPGGIGVSMDTGGAWLHPWFTRLFWAPVWKQWVAVVQPGLVNGLAPAVRTTARRMQQTPSFRVPVEAWFGQAEILQLAELASQEEPSATPDAPIWVPIYRSPAIALEWRALPAEGAPIPAYFTRRGIDGITRRVVSCDLVLHQPRMALTSSVEFPVDVVLGSSIVTQTLGVRTNASDHLKVYSTSDWEDPAIQNNPTTSADFGELTYDELLLARAYLVSPPGATGLPDQNWVPFVAHECFWNLHWWQPKLDYFDPGQTGAWIPPLAGGFGQLIINSVIASLNDATNNALNNIRAHSLAGVFWTPTGGGFDAHIPDPPASDPERYGFRKDLRLRAERAAAIKAGVPVDSLDPVFPYVGRPVPLSLLT